MSGYLYSARPLKAKDDPAPGAALMRGTERLGRLSPVEARDLAADLILSASASEAQWPKETAEAALQLRRRPARKPPTGDQP